MKVLMFGWEFPPFNMGGLGTACHGLTKGLCNQDIDVTFVLPKVVGNADITSSHVNLIVAENINIRSLKLRAVDSPICEYVDSASYSDAVRNCLEQSGKTSQGSVYGKNLFEEVRRFAEKCRLIAMHEDFDVIHAHDWMTYWAGKKAKEATGKPLVVHIHATEFDRTGDHPNQLIYDIEREGFHAADKIIAVSNLTRNRVIQHYGVHPDKVTVVHNAVEFTTPPPDAIKNDDKVVLFLGRITIQKGPEYFLHAAKKVLEVDDSVKFVVAGSGDMEPYIVELAANLGISRNVLFTGFLRGSDIDRAYRMASLYVMPSVSEPFGITPLEAMRNNTPCLISKNSGVSEVVSHCLKADFWDIDMMSNMMLATLNYKTLHQSLQENGKREVYSFNWNEPAAKCVSVYRDVLNRHYNNR
ncbi:glycosyltransferase family 4 protein [Candidatus Woesearchaeota archaeon]|nr:glycosyltransferase family 4 protein [Candidatus Woesearchaeota archaeon]